MKEVVLHAQSEIITKKALSQLEGSLSHEIKLLDEHYNNKHDNYRKVWSVYTFLKWYNVFFA